MRSQTDPSILHWWTPSATTCADFIKLTPSHLALLRQMDLSTSRIRRMVVGGENLATHLAAAVHAQLHGDVEMYNEYGPTEAVVGCAIHRYSPASDTARACRLADRPTTYSSTY